jgi:hypothetical protein
MVFPKQGEHTLRFDILSGILRRVVCRAGVASVPEPPLRRLPGLHRDATSGADGEVSHVGGRGDTLMALEAGMTVVDVSVIHPLSSTNLAAAAPTEQLRASETRRSAGDPTAWSPTATPSSHLVLSPEVAWANLRFASWLAWLRSRPEGQASLPSRLGPSGSWPDPGAKECAGAIFMFIGTVMGSWLVLWAGGFAPAWPGRRMKLCRS